MYSIDELEEFHKKQENFVAKQQVCIVIEMLYR